MLVLPLDAAAGVKASYVYDCNIVYVVQLRNVRFCTPEVQNDVSVPSGKSLEVPYFFPLNFKALDSPGKSLWSLKLL